ncbi:hypothetical protein BASA84_000729 [Batrachochytrium salamandrivorans]|nr:hypothetical protein BASA84_000729 [Batrachochytrium salamandrivorans]
MKVNSWTYGDLKSLDEVHDVGEVWASMLWEVYWNLVAKHGFATNLYDADQSAGNVIAMKIILGGMTIQSCNPPSVLLVMLSLLLISPTTTVPTSVRSSRDLPSVVSAQMLPAAARMTFRSHLNARSEGAPVPYDGISTTD